MTVVKRVLVFGLLAVFLLLSACGGAAYKDGVYTAEMPQFDDRGWKDVVELTIENGEIIKINWDAVYQDDSIPIRKKQYSKSGLYGMLEEAGAINEWYDQAVAAEQFVLENGIDALRYDADGFADGVAGCTIEVDHFDVLVRDCLAQAQK